MKKCLLIFTMIFSKVLTFPFGLSPFPALCCVTRWKTSRRTTFFIIILSSLLADLILSFLKGYPLFGYWSFFTITGFLWMALGGKNIMDSSSNTLNRPSLLGFFKSVGGITFISVTFWLWTNFGVWVFEPFYSKNIAGLLQCLLFALPFLGKFLLGNLMWMGLFLSIKSTIKPSFMNLNLNSI